MVINITLKAVMRYNKNLFSLDPYHVVSHKAWEFEDSKDVLKLDWNELSVEPSPNVRKALLKFIDSGKLNWYPDVDNKTLRKSIAKYCQIESDYVEYFGSSDHLHECILRALINNSDNVLILTPTYDNFRATAQAEGAEVIKLDTLNQNDNIFNLIADIVSKKNIKAIYFCNPNNPTGCDYDINEIIKLTKMYSDVWFLIDEAYFEFFGKTLCDKNVIDHNKNIIISRTFSKAFGLASMRIGYCVSHPEVLTEIKKVRNAKNISSMAQISAMAALDDVEYMYKVRDEILRAKADFISFLKKDLSDVFEASEGYGNFVMIKVLDNSKSELVKFLERHKIFIRNLSHLEGFEDVIRISIGISEQMDFVKRVICEKYNIKLNES